MPAGTPIFKPALIYLILVLVGTRILKHSAGRHYVPRPLSALFFVFFSVKRDKAWLACTWGSWWGAKKQPLPPLFDLLTPPFLYKYNHGLHGKGVGKCREKLERNGESFQECFVYKNSLKQTLLFKVLKLLKVEKSFRFNSPFIIFGTKTWKIFALKLS